MRLPTRKAERDRQQLSGNEPLYLTRVGLDKLTRRIERTRAELPAAREELTRTQAMGDLSENAAYQEAKYRLRRLQGSLLRMEEDLKRAIEIPDTTHDTVELGAHCTIERDGVQTRYHLVGPQEADILKGRLSFQSPLGAALLHKRAGEVVTYQGPSGPQTCTILSVS